MKLKTKKIMAAALSVTMAATITASQVISYAQERNYPVSSSERVEELSFYELTDSIDLSHIVQDNLSNQVVDYGEAEAVRNITNQNATATVIVSLDTMPLSQRSGDESIADYLKTADGAQALKEITLAQNKLLSDIAAAGIAYKEVARYNTVINAVAIEINTLQYSKISKIASVSMMGVSKTYAALSAVEAQENYSNIYGTGIYDSTEIMQKYGYDGSGITVAVLDTGLDYTHEAFSYDPEGEVAFEKNHIEELIDLGTLDASLRSPGLTADDVYLSAKVPFAYDYSDNDADVYPSYSQHGVHVAGIVAGKADTYVDKDGYVVGEAGDGIMDFLGVAPNAQLVICKVFTDNLESEDLGGATSEDIISALDDCAKLGVDIINMSLGTTSGFSNLEIAGDSEGEQLRLCYENLQAKGVSLIAAAGNEFSSGFGSEYGTNLASNPDSGTVGSPSTFTGSLSVASVNGQKAPYMVANPDEDNAYGNSAIYYQESSDANAVAWNFAEDMLDRADGIPNGVASITSHTFKYFVIPGAGEAGDYASLGTSIDAYKAANPSEPIIAVVRRGKTNFKDKVAVAKSNGFDGIIVYNNVPGSIRMSLADINMEEEWIPSASINMDAGTLLTVDPNNAGRLRKEGFIEINTSYEAGPFMNDYSSWGATPDLDLKPEITSHGGEITSAVSGGYQEMSGTSMATPNLAGLMALVRGYLKDIHPEYSAIELTRLSNQIVMSTATLLFDEEGLPYSPRKQGAGLATLRNIFQTKAYLWTDDAEDYRPKVELRDDPTKKGVYEFSFHVTNFGEEALTFTLVSRFFTEQLASNGLAVAEAAEMFDDVPAEFTVNGANRNGDDVTVNAGSTATISVKLQLSQAEKNYIDKSFKNGMYVEGFISLETANGVVEVGGQPSLNLPFMGFYGDWLAAPMLDYNAYEIAAFEQDSSILDAEKPHESVFATQLFSTYYNGRYGVPMGGYAYIQDEEADQVYVTEEHCSISRFNIYNGATANDNYMTSTGIRALYAGLLRNAELVTYDIYNVNTGEKVYTGEKYRIGKAYAGGGQATPALVDMKLDTEALGLINNGKYSIEFNFYMKATERGTDVAYDNQFTSNFYVDYDAPILQGSRIRYYDYKDSNNNIKQRIYLDIDIYDNHYPQAVLLCYSNEEYKPGDSIDPIEINLATEYVTPVLNAGRNTTTTVSIEITDIYEKYGNRLYVQLDDYALNHSVYAISKTTSENNNAEGGFTFVTDNKLTAKKNALGTTYSLTIEKNEMYRVQLAGVEANPSNYEWSNNGADNVILTHNNEIFGVNPGSAYISVIGGGTTLRLEVNVVDSSRTLPMPTFSFGVIEDDSRALVKAFGGVNVNAGQTFTIDIESDPWYYPVNTLTFEWASSKPEIAEVDQNGVVTTHNTRGSSIITATTTLPNGTSRIASVTLYVQEPFRIANMTLNKYYGSEKVVRLPDDKNIMYIGEEAFEDNDTMEVVIIPKTVVEIAERAFINCTALREVYFIDETKEGDIPVADLAKLNLVLADAFQGCTNLELVDLTNVKVITLARSVFAGCENLKTVRHSEKIGIAYDNAFQGCTSLEEIDITGLHTVGMNVFEGCTKLSTVTTGHYTAIGEGMFYGCTALESITINAPRVNGGQRYTGWMADEDEDGDTIWVAVGISGGAFENCTNLKTVTFNNVSDGKTWNNTEFRIGAYTFAGCSKLDTVNFNGLPASYIGDYAFRGTALTELTVYGTPTLGNNIFGNSNVTINFADSGYTTESNGAIYRGTTLVQAPATINASFTIKEGTQVIAPYAFSASRFTVNTITIPNSVVAMGEGAFYGAEITSITIPASLVSIPAYAFASSNLQSIVIPATVGEIGANAFEGCRSLTTVTFEEGVESIGDYAFASTAIRNVTLPASVSTMGSYVFARCNSLTKATLTAVKSLGDYTFTNCSNLQEVTFGAQATASGNYTFFPGDSWSGVAQSSLTTVDLGGLTELGEGMFWYCNRLTTIDLKNVTKVGRGAFFQCENLTSVIGIEDLTHIDGLAFAMTALTNTINLTNAIEIGDEAFYNVEMRYLNIPNAVSIGRMAFAGSLISSIEIPASLETLGAGAFMSSINLDTVTVEEGNKWFFVEEGDSVLYRYIQNAKTGEKNTYELVLYPSNRYATENEGEQAHYRVIDGTVSIQAYAFAYINSGSVLAVTLPYTLKTVGASAFYNPYNTRPITKYNFESIAAPALLSEYFDFTEKDPNNIYLTVFRSMYYTNFGEEIFWYLNELNYSYASSTTITYPSNGTGYNNYVYNLYFGTHIVRGEFQEDDMRILIGLIDSFDIDTVNSWLTLAVNTENTAMVTAFAEQVKEAHRLYNSFSSRTVQLSFLNSGANRAEKLFAVEAALKDVKARFNISAKIASAKVADSSQHRTTYVEGETFDLTGLVIEVTYDDYSTELITDTSLITLETTSPLATFDRNVNVTYGGQMFRISITVSAAGENGNGNGNGKPGDENDNGGGNDGGSGCAGCGSMDIGSTLGGTGLMLLTLVGALLLMQKARRKAND